MLSIPWLRLLSHVHWLAGWLADLISELKAQRYAFEMEQSCGARGYPAVTLWKAFSPHIFDNSNMVWSTFSCTSCNIQYK